MFLGSGDGTFSAAVHYAAGTRQFSVAVEDLNGDGKPDLATANISDNSVSVLLGNGDGTFRAAARYAVGASSRSIAVGDLNRDGKLDLVTANGSGSVSVLIGK